MILPILRQCLFKPCKCSYKLLVIAKLIDYSLIDEFRCLRAFGPEWVAQAKVLADQTSTWPKKMCLVNRPQECFARMWATNKLIGDSCYLRRAKKTISNTVSNVIKTTIAVKIFGREAVDTYNASIKSATTENTQQKAKKDKKTNTAKDKKKRKNVRSSIKFMIARVYSYQLINLGQRER